MKKDEMIDSIGEIDDDLIQAAEALRSRNALRKWKRLAGLAACFCLILGALAAIEDPPGETTPTVPNDFPVQLDSRPPEQTIQPAASAPVWDARYNEALFKLSANRAFIRGSFTEELSEAELAAVVPEGLDCTGCAVFDDRGNLLEVILTVDDPAPVTVIVTEYIFDVSYLLDGEADVSVCADTAYRLYQYDDESGTLLGADAMIGGYYFDFSLETTPSNLEQAKENFEAVLECFATYPDGSPDLSAVSPEEIPELMEQFFGTLEQARNEPDFGRFLPTELPDGFAESDIRRFRFDDSNYLSALWSRGLDDLSWVIRPWTETEEHRLTGVEELEHYDLSRYPIPRAESVPEELREIVEDPIFNANELTLEAVQRRAYKVDDAGDTDGWRMRFSVRYGDVLVSVSSKGVEPEWLYAQLKGLIPE